VAAGAIGHEELFSAVHEVCNSNRRCFSTCHCCACRSVNTTGGEEAEGEKKRTHKGVAAAGAASGSSHEAIHFPFRLLENVDNEEETNPHHVNEVPVIRHHNGAGGFTVGEVFHGVGATNDQQEGNKPAGNV